MIKAFLKALWNNCFRFWKSIFNNKLNIYILSKDGKNVEKEQVESDKEY